MIVQGTVQRLVLDDGMPRTEHRTRDLSSMLGETEWGWTGRVGDAYVFDFFAPAVVREHAYEQSATSHAETLREAGEAHVHPVPFGSQARQQRKEAMDEDRGRTTQRSAQEVYAETARRLGERD